MTESDLTFEQTREQSPQYLVYARALWQHPVARVTELIVFEPPYIVVLLDPTKSDSDDGEEFGFEFRGSVLHSILNYVNRLAEDATTNNLPAQT